MNAAALRDALIAWGSFYANHAAVRTLIAFVHVAALTTGGGAAIAADWRVLSSRRLDDATRRSRLSTLDSVHRVVTVGLVLIILSGLMMCAADVETYLHSVVFWTKMALTALLAVNGTILIMAGRRAAHAGDAWPLLRSTALASLALWFLTTLAGVALPNIG